MADARRQKLIDLGAETLADALLNLAYAGYTAWLINSVMAVKT